MKVLMTILVVALVAAFAWGVIDAGLHLHEFGLRALWCGQRGCP